MSKPTHRMNLRSLKFAFGFLTAISGADSSRNAKFVYLLCKVAAKPTPTPWDGKD